MSPLTRTCETALHVFGTPRDPGKPAFLSLVEAPEGTPERAAGVKIAPPRFLVREECRERWGHYVCDGRRSIGEISAEFPNFDFSEIVHDKDVFYTDERESDEHCCMRAVKFLEWLNKRPEKCIAVVTHSSFLRHLFGQFGENLHGDDMDSLQRLAGNCELRSIVLCSHGNKDGKVIDPLLPPMAAPSTGKRLPTLFHSLRLHSLRSSSLVNADTEPLFFVSSISAFLGRLLIVRMGNESLEALKI